MAYSDNVKNTGSEKVILAHIEPSEKLVLWSVFSGAVYERNVDNFVIDLKNGTTSLTEGSSTSLNAGEWYNDRENGKLYVRLSDDSNPQDAANFMVVTYRLFFSSAPYVLPHDLTDSGELVEYQPLFDSVSNFPQEIDNADQTGIALESNGSIRLFNRDGYFDDKFDKLFFENKRVAIYSWIALQPASENRQVFEGTIENKSFSEESVNFRAKDFVHKLREKTPQSLFSDSDGVISDDVRGKPKRTLYGQTDGVRLVPVDSVLGGYDLTGTVTLNTSTQTLTGSGTVFLKELSPEDEIFFEILGTEYRFRVESVETDSSATLAETPETSLANGSVKVAPNKAYRFANRVWHVAGHKLREPVASITEVIQLNRFKADTTDFFEGDTVTVNGESVLIKKIDYATNLFVLSQNLDTLPSVSDTVTKNPIRAVYFNGRKFLVDRDFTVSNTSSDCTITFDNQAEFNITPVQTIRATSVTFTNGSRDVSGVDTNFIDELSVNDWIRSDDPTHTTFYQVLQIVDETNLKIRVAYAGANNTGDAKKKNVKYLTDTSIVTVDCIGKEVSGKWIKTPSDVVLNLVQDAGFTNIDTDSFDEAVDDAPHIMALKIPVSFGADSPSLRDIVGLVNKSVFGSLYVKSDWSLAYSILNAERPNDLDEINDDDIDDWSVSTKTEIVRKVIGKYNHFDADKFTGEPGNAVYEYENDFVDKLIGSRETLVQDIYLYEERASETITQRYALLNSLTQSIVKIKAKLELTVKNINDKLFLGLDRLYKRFGVADSQRKIGIISRISRKSDGTDVQLTDLGNIFKRVLTVSPDDGNDFTSASDKEKIFNGYIVDNDTELPDSSPTTDDEWQTNLIG
jgi:hypothetical protein